MVGGGRRRAHRNSSAGHVVMSNVVLLNNVDHADLHVALDHGARFGARANQMLVFPTEFEEVQREFPILFRRNAAGEHRAVALLGLDPEENLFLGPEGWTSRYIPAVQQRGPFSIGLSEPAPGASPAAPMIYVDLDDPRVRRGDGEALFRDHGGNAPYLDHVLRVLRRIHAGHAMTGPMFAAFEVAGLLEPVALQISLDGSRQYDVPDCYTIGAKRLAGLAGPALEALHRAGFLRLAFMVAASLANVTRLIELKNLKRAADMCDPLVHEPA